MRLILQERSKGAQVTVNVCITDLLRTKEKEYKSAYKGFFKNKMQDRFFLI